MKIVKADDECYLIQLVQLDCNNYPSIRRTSFYLIEIRFRLAGTIMDVND
jgi:hypothetical protein